MLNNYNDLNSSKYWNRNETRFYLLFFFVSAAMLYAARTTMPICSSSMATEFNWNKTQTGLGLSSFFWGYTTTQVIGGYLADKFGGDVIISYTSLTWSSIFIIAPSFIHFMNKYSTLVGAVITQIILGCLQGVYFASLSSLFSTNVSPTERAFTFSVACSGVHIGTLISGSLGSILLEHFGWEMVYRFIGCLSFCWFLLFWLKAIYTSSIKYREKIQLEIKKLNWCDLLQKAPFWGIIISSFCYGWVFFVVLFWLPTFFKDRFPSEKSWVSNVVPWCLTLPAQWLSGFTADYMVLKGYKVNFVRKLFQSISFIGLGAFLFVLPRSSRYEYCLLFMTLAITCATCQHSGLAVNVQDIAPDHAGILFGLMNLSSSVPGFLGVYVTGYILDTTQSWTAVFTITAIISLIGSAIFNWFGTGNRII